MENAIVILFKKYDDKTYQLWTDKGDYVRNLTDNDIHLLCAELESECAIMSTTPNDFISSVWDLFCNNIFESYVDFDYYSESYKEFCDWFDNTVLAWYCQKIQGLI